MISIIDMSSCGVDERVEDAFQLCFEILSLVLAGMFPPKRIHQPLHGVEYAELMHLGVMMFQVWFSIADQDASLRERGVGLVHG